MQVPGSARYNQNMPNETISLPQSDTIRRYYRWHALIYDATRWTFLLGRNEILKKLGLEKMPSAALLEVGCGTGRNLRILAARHPNVSLTGIDVSNDMLERAFKATASYSRRVLLLEAAYSPEMRIKLAQKPDFVLFSYALTMFNPGWEAAIERAWQDLPVGGHIAVVDFHATPVAGFAWWMGKNHVRMDGHLLPYLQAKFTPVQQIVRPAYLGLWQYFIFIGQKEA